jgi:hypothetical protein
VAYRKLKALPSHSRGTLRQLQSKCLSHGGGQSGALLFDAEVVTVLMIGCTRHRAFGWGATDRLVAEEEEIVTSKGQAGPFGSNSDPPARGLAVTWLSGW